MTRHKRAPEQESEEAQDPAGPDLWPFIWLSAVVIAISIVVLGDPARGAEPVDTVTSTAPADENAVDPW
ncbi:hypothetical protein [Streptomyces phytophilus]|uniref:hypothetical protein n=1 Tax=Streptomyces phytophilus TaxID=722715 RepID=UPI0015F05E39|nr:hypothetical protein [Streptomyces phytophilus]